MKTSKKQSLADKIAEVLNTTPASFDPEDDNIDDTRAKLVENFSEEHEDEELLSSFRKENFELLSQEDKRYAGVKASRKNLYDSDEDFSEDSDTIEQKNIDNFESEDDENEDVDSEGSSEEADEDDEAESDENESSNENLADVSITENTEDIRHFNEVDETAEVKKGICVRNQMSLWEKLLEMRIQLQKCLISANKMPQKDKYLEIKKQSNPEFSEQVAITKNSLTNLLDKLLLLQKLSLSKYPETKKLNKSSEKINNEDDDDEEIPSDTEDELSSGEEENESEIPKKKRKLNDLERDINKRHSSYKNYRNSVIQKWNDKTRIAMLKNNTNSHSVVNHIEHTLSDRAKLVRRTQLKRSDYTVLGQEFRTVNESKEENISVEEYNTEIFDDDDFYHQLLRELIEVKSADLTDPILLGRQWIQLQKLRNKMKRKIDTKATKGRKIRYTVHKKLVNFMAPIDEYLWTDQAKTELFNSLFGKKEYSGNS